MKERLSRRIIILEIIKEFEGAASLKEIENRALEDLAEKGIFRCMITDLNKTYQVLLVFRQEVSQLSNSDRLHLEAYFRTRFQEASRQKPPWHLMRRRERLLEQRLTCLGNRWRHHLPRSVSPFISSVTRTQLGDLEVIVCHKQSKAT